VAILIVLAGCAGAQSAATPGDAAGRPADAEGPLPAASGQDFTSDEQGGGSQTARAPLAAPIEQRIIKTGEVSIEVANVAGALGRVRAMALELGGYVGGSQAGTLEEAATLTLRIPADRFEDALARLHELDGEVVAEGTREEDVTSQVVDLGARIANLQASEASYRELVARAERVEDILAVQARLDEVRSQIEQLTAQLEALEDQAALSTLTVTLLPTPEPVSEQAEAWDPKGELDRALAALFSIGQGLIGGLIWFVVVWVPVLLVLGVALLLALRGFLEVRRRMPALATAESTAGREER
jgi:hypothetical protein